LLNWYAEQGEAPWHVIVLLSLLTFAAEVWGGDGVSCNRAPWVEKNDCVIMCGGLVREWNPNTCRCGGFVDDKRQVH
jgi:hypothetical protein